MELNIENVKDTVRLIERVNCQPFALISEVAKEMGVKKTQVMAYIESHPKLFILVEVKKGDKVLGLGIRAVYSEAVQNPETEEWTAEKIAQWDHKLHVAPYLYYDQLEFYYFPEELSKTKEQKYRNTMDKFRQLEEEGLLKKTTQGYGGLSDYFKTDVYLCDGEALKRLADAGWSTDFEEVSSKFRNS